MSRWLARVDDLLYDGETVESEVSIGEGGVVVTSHRVLAFTPERDGANYDYADRPNVAGVERRTRGKTVLVGPAVKAFVVGGFLLAAGQLVSLDGLVGSVDLSGTGQLGLGGFVRMMQTMMDLLAMLDEVMTVLGAVSLLAAVLLVGGYLWTRESILVVAVGGDDDLVLSRDEGEEDVLERLERAVRPGPAASTDDGDASPAVSDDDPLA